MAEPEPENAATTTPELDPAAAEATTALPEAAPAEGATASQEDAVSAVAAAAEQLDASPAESADELDLSQLPLHTRSLLKVRVVVTVALAHQRRPLHEITELGPGTLVKFEKTYDEPLVLSVGNLPIAVGEVVKVGDKFGLRIGKIIRPHERFASVAK
jgi:flagellar motor switch protein FliN/FliY